MLLLVWGDYYQFARGNSGPEAAGLGYRLQIRFQPTDEQDMEIDTLKPQ